METNRDAATHSAAGGGTIGRVDMEAGSADRVEGALTPARLLVLVIVVLVMVLALILILHNAFRTV